MQKKELPVFKNITVVDVAEEGKSIAKAGNLVIFLSNAVPGDIVDIQVTRKKKSFFEGEVIHFHKYSDKRTEPFCEHFGLCGGCKRQNMSYEAQLYYKQKQVEDCMNRIALIKEVRIMPVIPSKKTEYYRNKLEFTFSNKRWLTDDEIKSIPPLIEERGQGGEALGFHIPQRFDKVLDIRRCHLQKDPSNAIRLAVKEYAIKNELSFFDIRKQEGFCRNLIIRTSPTCEIMVIISFFHEDVKKRECLLNHLAEKFPEIISLMYVINPKKMIIFPTWKFICLKEGIIFVRKWKG